MRTRAHGHAHRCTDRCRAAPVACRYTITGCDVVWVIREDQIGNLYFDAGAATFLLACMQSRAAAHATPPVAAAMRQPSQAPAAHVSGPGDAVIGISGPSLGPQWCSTGELRGARADGPAVQGGQLRIEYACTAEEVLLTSQGAAQTSGADDWPVTVRLSNGHMHDCDFVISATGVVPNTEFLRGVCCLAADGGVLVDERLRSSNPRIFAAGDACTVAWPTAATWFQMRLWSQARQMGLYAARSMDAAARDEPCDLDICFETFAHTTRFFGHKVILLGRYNAQGLRPDQYELHVRCEPEQEYVKVVVSTDTGQLLVRSCATAHQQALRRLTAALAPGRAADWINRS